MNYSHRRGEADKQNEHQQTLREISKIAIINEFSTFVAWS